jgi:O-glycosyl hydrolase
MNVNHLLFAVCSLFAVASCSSEDLLNTQSGQPEEMETKGLLKNSVQINWNSEKQEIDGFGVGQAAWVKHLYANRKREEVMSLLFGENGLNLNILRGEVFPDYWENEADSTFNVTDNVDISLDDPLFSCLTTGNAAEVKDLNRRGQLWASREAQNTYQVDKLIYATWSPPAFMKTNGATSDGKLKPEYFQTYADYLTKFCKAYQSVGVNVYGLTPANEPEYAAPWNSCLWAAQDMGKFITQNLHPTLSGAGLNQKILFGESAQWSAPLISSVINISSKKYVENVLASYPEIVNCSAIASGHGYGLPLSEVIESLPNIDVPIIPYTKAEEKGLKVWLTEVSTIDRLNPTIENGLEWAGKFNKYLVDANVSAIVWWVGAMSTTTNESMIILDADRSGYTLTKRYETYGNFTRYIKPGSKRIETKRSFLSTNISFSSFKKGNEYVLVAVNESNKAVDYEMKLNGTVGNGNLNAFLTNATSQWAPSEVTPNANGTYSLQLPPKSVVTFTGSVK